MGQQGIIVNFQAQLGFLLCSEIPGDTRVFLPLSQQNASAWKSPNSLNRATVCLGTH